MTIRGCRIEIEVAENGFVVKATDTTGNSVLSVFGTEDAGSMISSICDALDINDAVYGPQPAPFEDGATSEGGKSSANKISVSDI